ncbi:hypothetical protein J6O48_06520 [bacterium]|nr:hypothetical protein [bacterium]
MVSVNSDVQNYNNLSNFSRTMRQNNTIPAVSNKVTLTDKFITGVKNQEEIDTKGNWALRNVGMFTAQIPLYLGYLYGLEQLIKACGAPKGQVAKAFGKSFKNIGIAAAISSCISFAISKYLNSKTEENNKKLAQTFNEINTDTNAKMADKMSYPKTAEAFYYPMSGKIQFNQNTINDPILSRNIDKKIKHELVHAKQYETVARSQDGIKKVNYVTLNQIKRNIEKANAKESFDAIYKDIQNNGNKYDDTRIKLMGGAVEVNLKDYITALHTLLNNPDATYNDIPIVIDLKHYQEVIDKKGKLTPDEETKADEYYKAMLDYKSVNFFSALNPWSDYRQNILEKEAYKENPSIITKMSDWFGQG